MFCGRIYQFLKPGLRVVDLLKTTVAFPCLQAIKQSKKGPPCCLQSVTWSIKSPFFAFLHFSPTSRVFLKSLMHMLSLSLSVFGAFLQRYSTTYRPGIYTAAFTAFFFFVWTDTFPDFLKTSWCKAADLKTRFS